MRGASHQPAFMGSCLTISHTCLPCPPVFYAPLLMVRNGGSVDVWIASAKSQSARGASQQLAFMGSWQTISHTCFSCLPNRWVWSLYSMAPYDWANNVGSVDVFLNVEYGFTPMGSRFNAWEWVWNLGTKLCCIYSGNWNFSRVLLQWFDTRYIMFQVNQPEGISVA